MVRELAIALCHLLSERSVSVEAEVEALEGDVDIQTHGVVRIRVTDHRLVIVALVNLSIAVFILPVATDKLCCAVKDAMFVLIVIEAIM